MLAVECSGGTSGLPALSKCSYRKRHKITHPLDRFSKLDISPQQEECQAVRKRVVRFSEPSSLRVNRSRLENWSRGGTLSRIVYGGGMLSRVARGAPTGGASHATAVPLLRAAKDLLWDWRCDVLASSTT